MRIHELRLAKMSFHDPITAAETDAQVLRDVQLLERAAKEWRWLAWLWVFGGVVFSVPLLINLISVFDGANGAGPQKVRQAIFGLILLLFIFGIVSSVYFLIARRISRGQRWAVGMALFIAAVAAAATIARIFWRLVHQQAFVGHMVMEAVMLFAHLNLLRVLFQSYGATQRIRQMANARMNEDASAP